MFSVLIVDDDVATVDVIRDTVNWSELGVTRVLEAYHVEQAKRILAEGPVDIVISDIEMPGATGLDLLEWDRAQNRQEQFLLLTCHESFTYASQAIRYRAADYLLKPFDSQVVEMALRKVISSVIEQRNLLENDRWVKENARRLQLSFWEDVFRGQYDGTPERLWSALSRQAMPLSREGEYYLVVGRITNLEHDVERYGRKLFRYALENIHSETLCGSTENRSVVCLDNRSHMVVCSVCPAQPPEEMERRCGELMQGFRSVMSSELTCCICGPCPIDRMYDLRDSALDLMAWNVGKYGTVFWERDLDRNRDASAPPLDAERVAALLEENNKRSFLEYLRERLEEAKADNRLFRGFLFEMRQQILQAVYVDLAKNGINAPRVVSDEVMRELSEKSTQSSLDMMRWASSVVNIAIERKREVNTGESLSRKIDQYIEANYQQDLNRDRIAEAFFLSPGYLGKLYKKETGKNIKDTLTECRVRHARQQLAVPGLRIIEIANDVGFENVTYFSTIFKKYTGMTPYEYRKSVLGESEQERIP